MIREELDSERVNVKVYDIGIIAPCKCGTRFLDSVCTLTHDISETSIFKNREWKGFAGWIIYREPYEWMVSALHTEILNRKEWEGVEDILERFLREGGTTHYSDTTFKRMWEWLSMNRKCKGVPLSQLSKLLRTLGVEASEVWREMDWEFRHLDKKWMSKEDVVRMIQKGYPIEWEWLLTCVKDEEVYWNRIVNGEWKEIKLI